jgi:hypothetical protein
MAKYHFRTCSKIRLCYLETAFQASSPKTQRADLSEVGPFFSSQIALAGRVPHAFTRIIGEEAAGKTGKRRATCGGSSARGLLSSAFVFVLWKFVAQRAGAQAIYPRLF